MTTQENMLARYKILHEIGRGAIGAVYAASDRETGKVVALKRLDPALLSKSDASIAERFLKQARSARLLKHRNVVRVYDAAEVGGTVYVAMEMLEGKSLRTILDEGPLAVARAIHIVRDIASGLAHAHLEGVVHGGLKPSDIVVSPSGAAKIADFGIGPLAPAGAQAGSLGYLSPEQVRGDPVDHRCDIFSLGALFYEMLAHRAPFAGGSPKEITENILRARPPLPSELNPLVPRALDRIVSSMLAGQPAARMPGIPILLRDLQGLEEGLGLGSRVSASVGESPATPLRAEPAPKPQAPAPDLSGIRAVRRNAQRPAPEGATRAASAARSFAAPSRAESLEPGDRMTDREAFDYQKAIALMERESRRERTSGPRRSVFAALAVVLTAIGIGLGGFAYYSAGPSDRGIFVSARDSALEWLAERSRNARADRAETARAAPSPATQEAPATTQMVSRAVAPAPVVDATPGSAPAPAAKPAAPKALPPEPAVLAKNDSPPARAPAQPAKRGIGEEPPQQPAAAPAAPDASPPHAAGDGQEAQLSSVSTAADPAPPEPAAQAPLPLTKKAAAAPAPKQPPSARTVPARTLPRAKQPTPEVQQQQRAGTARVILSVSPRGEIYIDGKHHGTTPPITSLELEPGMHRIEVRSGSSTPYLTYVTLQTGDVRHIRYDFDVSRAVYPGKRASWQRSERAAR